MRRFVCVLMVLAACGRRDRGGDDASGGGDGDGSGGGGNALSLDDREVADRALELLAGWPGATLQLDLPCPMEHDVGDAFFHVLEHGFPSHVFSDSAIEFPLLSTYGPGPMELGGVVVCIEDASGFVTVDEPAVEGMPMMDDPLPISVRGETSTDEAIVGQSVVVALGVVNADGDAGLYGTALAQICADDGSGCEQACDDPIAPGGAQVDVGTAVCAPDQAIGEDGSFAALGRTAADLLTAIDGVPVASCVRADFPGGPDAQTIRVVASWVRQDACGLDACVDAGCGDGHGFGVFSSDDGATFSFRGVAQGTGTTALVPADPSVPEVPFVGEHFLVGGAVSSVLVCRLGHGDDADQVAVDHVELCP